MKEQINQKDIKEFNRAAWIYTILFIIMVVSIIPLHHFLGIAGLVIWLLFAAVTMLYALHVEKLKKQHNIQSYKEITAFMEGKRLDELESAVEKGKRPYQKLLLILGSALLGLLFGALAVMLK